VITENKEDYLKVIYELGGSTSQVSNKDIFTALGASTHSVSEMIKLHDVIGSRKIYVV
jgi:DtxR family Mn-dependent transcriptional regulator